MTCLSLLTVTGVEKRKKKKKFHARLIHYSYPFAQKHHNHTGSYRGSHHHVGSLYSDFVSGSINHLKPVEEAHVHMNTH